MTPAEPCELCGAVDWCDCAGRLIMVPAAVPPPPEVYCAVHRDGDGDLHYHVVRWKAARLFADLAGSLEPPGLAFVALFALCPSGWWASVKVEELAGAEEAMRWLGSVAL